MNVNKKTTQSHIGLLNRLAEELMRGVALIEELTDEIYLNTKNGVGSIGAHVRHNLDFADNFLCGLEIGKINYNSRERDLRTEQDRKYAKERFLFLIKRFKSISADVLDRDVYVCSEVDDSNWYKSTGARELEFVHSHTVHHYALIAEKLEPYGMEVSRDFGVAPSTLKYWSENEEETKVA